MLFKKDNNTIKQALHTYKNQYSPDSSWVSRNKLTLLDTISSDSSESSSFSFSERVYEVYATFVPRHLLAVTRPLMIVFLSTALLLGSWGVRVASANSLPGELLYSVKRADESVQLALTTDPKEKVKKNLEFATRRNNEIEGIKQRKQENPDAAVEEKSLKQLEKTVQSLEQNIKDAEQTVKQLQANTSQSKDVLEVAVQFRETAEGITQSLTGNVQQIVAGGADSLPAESLVDEQARALVQKTVQTTQVVGQADIAVIEHVVATVVESKTDVGIADDTKHMVANLVKQKAASLAAEVELRNTSLSPSSSIMTAPVSSTTSTSALDTTVGTSSLLLTSTTPMVGILTPIVSSTAEVSEFAKKVVQEVEGLAPTDLLGALQKVKELQQGVTIQAESPYSNTPPATNTSTIPSLLQGS